MDDDKKIESQVSDLPNISESDDVDSVISKKPKAKPLLYGLVVLIIIVVAGIGYMAWNLFGASTGPTVAKVNDQPISQADFDNFYLQQQAVFQTQGLDITNTDQVAAAKQQALNTLVEQTLLMQAAAQGGITISDQLVQTEYDNTYNQFESEEAFQQALTENNLTAQDLRNNIHKQLTIQQYLAPQVDQNVTASAEEVQALYDQYVQQGSNIPALEEVRTQLEEQVKQQKIDQQISAIIESLRQTAQIELF